MGVWFRVEGREEEMRLATHNARAKDWERFWRERLLFRAWECDGGSVVFGVCCRSIARRVC
jgi:hypothetical protein